MKRRDEAALRVLLALCAGCAWLAAASALSSGVPRDGAVLLVVCVAWLIFAPLYERDVRRVVRRLPGVGAGLAWLVRLSQALPLALVPAPLPETLLFGSAILIQAHLFLDRDDDQRAMGCLSLAPFVTVVALAMAPSLTLLALLPISCVLGLGALVLLQARIARRCVRRTPPAPARAGETRSRLVYAGLASLLMLPSVAALFLATQRTLTALARRTAPAAASERLVDAERPASQPGAQGSGSGGAAPDFGVDLGLSGGAFPYSDEIVMRVRPAGERESRQLHMRAIVLDHFHSKGISLRRRTTPPRFTDAGDGVRDGWTHFGPRLPPSATRRYAVQMRPLSVETVAWTILFAPIPLVAVRYDPVLDEPVLYDPERLLVVPRLLQEWFGYEIEVARRELTFAELKALRATHPDAQYTQLPAHEAAAAITARGRELLRGPRSDFDKVRRVVNHLRTHFTYELRPMDLEGPAAVAEFLEEGRGYCTYFAAAATLMLRSEGIAARVVTGFLAKEWSEEEGLWLVRERDSHAWIEVHFDAVGWLTFDPTPVSPGSSGVPEELVDESTDWPAALRSSIAEWIGSGGVGLDEVLATLLAGPQRFLARHPSAWLLLGAALLFGAHLARTSAAAGRAALGPEPTPLPPLFARLARALARLGHRRPPGQTPREFARDVAGRENETFAPLPRAIDLYYRDRFGQRRLEAWEAGLVEALTASLERLAAAREGSS